MSQTDFMRLITADYIFPISEDPIVNGYLLINQDGEIISLLNEAEFSKGNFENIPLEKHQGIICPGFINSHCHLELSYLKNLVPQKKGLAGFVWDLQKIRNQYSEKEIHLAIEKANQQMYDNGIVAVGDICNGNSTFSTKAKSKIKYYNFLELFGFENDKADETYNRALLLSDELVKTAGINNTYSIIPHSPYSVSNKLFKKIGESCYAKGNIISMHNQETKDENTLFKSKSGEIAQMLLSFGLKLDQWNPSGFNSMPSVMVNLPKCNKTLLVHNTFTNKEDIEWANNYSKMIWWCFCPNANLYIENALPDFSLFKNLKNRLTIGTDSLASNQNLSVLEELKTIQNNTNSFSLDDLLKMATQNGADFFEFKELGSFEKGKIPGVNLITNVDLKGLKLTPQSAIKKLA